MHMSKQRIVGSSATAVAQTVFLRRFRVEKSRTLAPKDLRWVSKGRCQ